MVGPGVFPPPQFRQLEASCEAVDDLGRATESAIRVYPDASIRLSFPGIGPQTGTRILAEIGDDRTGFATAGGLKADAGAVPHHPGFFAALQRGR
ncbi:transposase [Streptomyces sp. IBSNAI002]|uniref:transposase n=1 Tax=Streptomyces sp. IBSNAI002 TaxID=3457500 RepID=UPI003FD09171